MAIPYPPLPPVTRLIDCCFRGGTALGTAYSGTLTAFAVEGIWFRRVCGTSAGATTAAMIAAGYSANELDFISSPPDFRPEMPPSLAPVATVLRAAGIELPFAFGPLLDLPDLLNQGQFRTTALWELLSGGPIESMLNALLATPDGADAAQTAMFTQVRNHVLASWQNPLERQLLGDQLMRSLITGAPDPFFNSFISFLTHFLYHGAIFKGDTLLASLKALIGARVAGSATVDVTFAQLPLDLALIATRLGTGGALEIYSKLKSPNMSVAEAVRRSMGIPFVYAPRHDPASSDVFVDGGVVENYPFWLLLEPAASEVFLPVNDEADVVAFDLDTMLEAPEAYRVMPGPFDPTDPDPNNSPPTEFDLIREKWGVDLSWLPDPASNANADGVFPPATPRRTNPDGTAGAGGNAEVALINYMIKLFQTAYHAKFEQPVTGRAAVRHAEIANPRFFNQSVPVLGHSGFDFEINTDRDDTSRYENITARGYEAAVDVMRRMGVYDLKGGASTAPFIHLTRPDLPRPYETPEDERNTSRFELYASRIHSDGVFLEPPDDVIVAGDWTIAEPLQLGQTTFVQFVELSSGKSFLHRLQATTPLVGPARLQWGSLNTGSFSGKTRLLYFYNEGAQMRRFRLVSGGEYFDTPIDSNAVDGTTVTGRLSLAVTHAVGVKVGNNGEHAILAITSSGEGRLFRLTGGRLTADPNWDANASGPGTIPIRDRRDEEAWDVRSVELDDGGYVVFTSPELVQICRVFPEGLRTSDRQQFSFTTGPEHCATFQVLENGQSHHFFTLWNRQGSAHVVAISRGRFRGRSVRYQWPKGIRAVAFPVVHGRPPIDGPGLDPVIPAIVVVRDRNRF